MEEPISYRKEFLDAVYGLKKDVDLSLIDFVHVVQGGAPDADKIDARRRLEALADELRAAIDSFDVASINKYNLRDQENRAIAKFAALSTGFAEYRSYLERQLKVVVDQGMSFSLNDVSDTLAASRIASEPAIDKERLQSLYGIRDFVLKLYAVQVVPLEQARDERFERSFYDLREKTFLQALHNDANLRPEIYFRCVELLKKKAGEMRGFVYAADGEKPVEPWHVVYGPSGDGFTLRYREPDLDLSMTIHRERDEPCFLYSIAGRIEKTGAGVDFSIEEKVFPEEVVVAERLMGLDYILSQYGSAYVDYTNRRERDASRREERDYSAVKKGLDDLLFG
jgi:hypothetical protein